MLDLKSLISRHSFFPLSDPEFDSLFDDLAVFFEFAFVVEGLRAVWVLDSWEAAPWPPDYYTFSNYLTWINRYK